MPIKSRIRSRSLTRAAAALAVAAAVLAGSSSIEARADAMGEPATGIPILMYHRIVPPAQAPDALRDLVVAPEEFAAQMAVLHQTGWRSMTLAELAHDKAAGTPAPSRVFVITIDDGRSDGYDFARPILRGFGYRATYFVVAGRVGKPGNMTADQLRTLVAEADEVGDHTASHVVLTGLGRAQLSREICDAADSIEKIAGRRPETFAYPNGRYDAASEAAVRSCPGIILAVTTRRVAGGESRTGPFEVPRIPVEPGTSPTDLLHTMESHT